MTVEIFEVMPRAEIEAQLAQITTLVSSYKQAGDIDDTASINRALSYVNTLGGGKVRIPYRNTPYILSSALIMYSNTHLEVDPYAIIMLANGANCRMIENANKTTQSNLTITDVNIKVTGGIWNGNGANQTKKWDDQPNTSSIMAGFFFAGVQNLTFCPTQILNTKVYGCLFANVTNLLIENVDINVGDVSNPNNVDGIHVLGPASIIRILNCSVKSEDNAIAINADDVGHGPYGTVGDIDNVQIQNIFLNNYTGGQGMLLLSGTHKVDHVRVENIHGKSGYLMNISSFDMGQGNYGTITIADTDVEAVANTTNAHIWVHGSINELNLQNINIPKNSDLQQTQYISVYTSTSYPTMTIDRFNIDNMRVNRALGSSTLNVIQIGSGVTVNNLFINKFESRLNSITVNPLSLTSCTIAQLLISQLNVDGVTNNGIVNSGATIGTLILDTQSTGSFTPVISGGTTAGTGTYSQQTGYYSKNAKLVHFEVIVTWSAHTGTGQMYISLPLPIDSNAPTYIPVNIISSGVYTSEVLGLTFQSGQRIQLYYMNGTSLSPLPMQPSGTLYISGSYIAQ